MEIFQIPKKYPIKFSATKKIEQKLKTTTAIFSAFKLSVSFLDPSFTNFLSFLPSPFYYLTTQRNQSS